jgi:hypothetical protein
LAQRRSKIFLLTNWQVVEPLIDAFNSKNLALVLLCSQWPKTPSFLWRCLRKGIILSNLPDQSLSKEDHKNLSKIRSRIEDIWASPAVGLEKARREFIQTRILSQDWIERRAREVRRYEKFFSNHNLARVMVGDAGNAGSRLVIEMARQNRVPSDELPNGMLVTDQKLDARTGDGVNGPLLTRFFAWGPQQAEWIKSTGAPVDCIKTGYPGIDLLRRIPHNNKGRRKNILVLGTWIDGYDVIGLHSFKLSYTLEAVKYLKDAGFDDIRVKIHPSTPKLDYYKEAFLSHDLDCEIYKSGPLQNHLDWADAVIGPISSGSIVEALAAGRPYFTLRQYPTLISDTYAAEIGAYDTPRQLVQALKSGWEPDRERVLNYLCSFSDIPNASKKVWEVIEKSITDHLHLSRARAQEPCTTHSSSKEI